MASVPANRVMDDDVLFGRGGGTNKHPGNMRFRDMIDLHRQEYQTAERNEKLKIAGKIVRAVRYGETKGRFLRKDDDGWREVGNDEAMRKTSAALREKTKWTSLQDTPAAKAAAAKGEGAAKKRASEKPKAKKNAKKAAKGGKPVKSAGGSIVPREEDVLFGRGGGTNRHPGNLLYRDMINLHRTDYQNADWDEKVKIAGRIVEDIHTGEIPGRFLRKDDDGEWYEVGTDEAARKVLAALREKSKWSGMTPEKGEKPAAAGAGASPAGEFGPADEAAVDFLAKIVKKEAKRKAQPAKKPPAEAASKPAATEKPAAKRKVGADDGESPDAKRVKSEAPPAPIRLLPEQAAAVNAFGLSVSNIVIPPLERKENPKPPAKAGSAVILPNEEDVLLGRGGGTNHQPGNKRMRATVAIYRDLYNQAKREDKKGISAVVVNALRRADPPSRFLRVNEETGLYEEVDDKRAAQKISQLMREKEAKTESRII